MSHQRNLNVVIKPATLAKLCTDLWAIGPAAVHVHADTKTGRVSLLFDDEVSDRVSDVLASARDAEPDAEPEPTDAPSVVSTTPEASASAE